ncbi:MAG: VOC family protein [Blautia sp.]|uniref:VOC family protein n=1 Tax=Blautia TaxID=572511 RepID=UPI002589D8CB|nr:VOC family protein [Blautia sp.]MCI7288453.1 VOC family protein [Blautia sp.]
MNLREQLNGVQHIGIPTNDIENTIEFYQKLGFEIAFQTVNEEANEKVVFLKLHTLVIETYENKAAVMQSGAINHIAIDVKDIEKVYAMINQAGLNSTQDTVHFLPFWENGVKFFTIEGPNKEKVEFSQYL